MTISMQNTTLDDLRIKTYAKAVYVFGTNRLTQRDGCSGVPDTFREKVMAYAAVHFTGDQLLVALDYRWIDQMEYESTAIKLSI